MECSHQCSTDTASGRALLRKPLTTTATTKEILKFQGKLPQPCFVGPCLICSPGAVTADHRERNKISSEYRPAQDQETAEFMAPREPCAATGAISKVSQFPKEDLGCPQPLTRRERLSVEDMSGAETHGCHTLLPNFLSNLRQKHCQYGIWSPQNSLGSLQ